MTEADLDKKQQQKNKNCGLIEKKCTNGTIAIMRIQRNQFKIE